MRYVLFLCGVHVIVTVLLIAKVNTENITKRSKIFQRSAQEEVLIGHVIQSTQASSDINCLMDCSREQRCLSFNYKSITHDGKPVCELNDQTRESSPDSVVVSVDGYYYYGPESSCTSDRCLNGGTCQPVIDDPHQRYQCQCSPDFTGERCQYPMQEFDVSFPGRNASDYVLLTKMSHHLTSFTISLFVNLSKNGDHTFVSYATTSFENAIFFYQRASVLQVRINNVMREFQPFRINADGSWRHLALTWESSLGDVTLYIDGMPRVNVVNYARGHIVEANGIVSIGNDQDSYGGGFEAADALCGSISRVNIWNTVLPSHAITSLAGKCGNEAGTFVAWNDFRKGAAGVSYHGEARAIVPSRCKYP